MTHRPGPPNARTAIYPGIDADRDSGMTEFGRIVRDAWVFGLLPEGETCAGWTGGQMQGLLEKVYAAWEPFDHLPSRLPEGLRQRHERIHDEAVARARAAGWDAELDEED
jgi:hypothetical protein